MSTTELKTELHEGAKRTKLRLEKLKKFGFVDVKQVTKKPQIQNWWYPDHACMYLILSTFRISETRRKFISTNKEKSNLNVLLKSRVTDNQLKFFLKDIRACVKKQQYREIMKVVVLIYYKYFNICKLAHITASRIRDN